jgi:hypothetical protein
MAAAGFAGKMARAAGNAIKKRNGFEVFISDLGEGLKGGNARGGNPNRSLSKICQAGQ